MNLPTIDPAWRTSAVTGICAAMREQQDFGVMPVLADALGDAGCDDADLLARLRKGPQGYAADCTLVACVYSRAAADAAAWLTGYASTADCPRYGVLLNAAAGRHDLNDGDDGYRFSEIADWGESYLHFNGSDAHGPIPAEFWDYVQAVTGKAIHDRPSSFSCSC